MARIQGYSEDDVDLLVTDFARVIQGAVVRTVTAVTADLATLQASSHVFHLPGKHNQKAHGHQSTVSVDDQAQFARRLRKARSGDKAHKSVTSSDAYVAVGGGKKGSSQPRGWGISGPDTIHEMVGGQAALGYQISGVQINEGLRTGGDAEWGVFRDPHNPGGKIGIGYYDEIAGFDKVMAHHRSELKRDIMVERGIENPGHVFGDSWSSTRSNVGLTWDDDGFVSTTTSHDIATRFAAHTEGTTPVRARILVPRGSHAMTMGEIGTKAKYASEKEVVLPRGQRYRIMADHGVDVDGIHNIDVEILGSAADITAAATVPVTIVPLNDDDEDGDRQPNYIDRGPPVIVHRFALFEQATGLYTAPDLQDDGENVVVAHSFHLPGKHNQKAHGHKTKVSAGEQEEFKTRLGAATSGEAAYDDVTTTDEFTSHGAADLGPGHDMGKAANDYQADAYVINGDLRDGRSEEWAGQKYGDYTATTHTLDAALTDDASEIDTDMMLERGVEHPGHVWGSSWSATRSNVGLTWDDAGFTSTSTSHQVASNFAAHRSDTKLAPARMRILVPAGSHAIRMGQHGTIKDYDDEKEVLLPRRSRFRIMADHGVGADGVHDIDVEYLGPSLDEIVSALLPEELALVAAGPKRVPNCIDQGPLVNVLRFALFEQPDGTYTAPDMADYEDALTADVSTNDVASVTQRWQEEIDHTLTPYVAEVYTGSAAQVAIGVGKSFPEHAQPGVQLLPDQFAVEFMKTTSNQLSGVGNELWEDIRNELLNGQMQGESIEQIATRIKTVGNLTTSQATRIARTHIHSAAEGGSIAQLRFMGYADSEVKKEWLTVHDARVRETHVAVDHHTVLLNEKFTVGGWPLDHPGDMTAPAGEVENCRCTMVFNIEDPPPMECRCLPAIVAAGEEATVCVVPVSPASIDHISPTEQKHFYDMFAEAGITPAYGGAKILKVLDEVLAKVAKESPEFAAMLDREKLLAIVDKHYVAKKDTFGAKYHSWAQTPAGKKALGGAVPKITGVKAPIAKAAKKAVKAAKAVPTPKPVSPFAQPMLEALGVGDIDITQFDFFFKEDLAEMWLALGKGKKVTPAWGGSKIYKMVTELRANMLEQDPGLKITERQILRILDEKLPAKAKYETTVMDWLASPAGKKAVPNPPVNLAVKELAPSPSPVASTPVIVQPKAVLTQGVAGSPADFIKLEDSKLLYPAGTTLAHKPGEVFQYRMLSKGGGYVDLQQRAPGGEWSLLKSLSPGDDVGKWTKLGGNSEGWLFGEAPLGAVVSEAVSTPVVPVAGLLPGAVEDVLATGENVSFTELFTLIENYEPGEVMAYAKTSLGDVMRFTRSGNGIALHKQYAGDTKWSFLGSYGHVKEAPYKTIANLHLAPSKLAGKTPSAMPGKLPGDKVTISQVITANWAPGEEMAYTKGVNGWDYKLIMSNGGKPIALAKPSDIVTTWDIVKIEDVPTTGWTLGPDVIVGKVPSKIPTYKVGDVLPSEQIDLVQQHFNPDDVMAYAYDPATHYEYRLRVSPLGTLKIDSRIAGGNSWSYDIVTNKNNKTWRVAKVDGKAPPEHVAIVPTKPTPSAFVAPIPKPSAVAYEPSGIPVHGTPVTPEQIFTTEAKKYNDGDIVAIGTAPSYYNVSSYRVVKIGDHLVLQHQTKSGTWTGSKFVSSKWDIPATPKWTTVVGSVPTKPQYTAMKKLVTKQTASFTEKAQMIAEEMAKKEAANAKKKAAAETKITAQKLKLVKKPPKLEPHKESVAKYSKTEKEHIFAEFKGLSKGQLLGSKDEDFVATLWALSEYFEVENPEVYAGLTIRQVAQAIDEVASEKLSKANAHLFEAKLVKYMESDAGKEFVASQKYLSNSVVDEVFQTDVVWPEGVTVRPTQRVQLTSQPAWDETVPSSAFRRTNAHDQAAMQRRMFEEQSAWKAPERAALRSYTSGAYHSWNGYLRQTGGYKTVSASIREAILNAQAGMRQLPENVLLLRGTGWEQFPVGYRSFEDVQKLIGREITDPAFLSTSTANDFGGFGGQVKIELEAPTGTWAAWVKEISHNSRENEVVIAAGSKYRILEVRKDGYQVIVRMRVVG
jgi:hypothetical protein